MHPPPTLARIPLLGVSAYYIYRLSAHVASFMHAGNRASLCGTTSHWAWSFSSDCFRAGFLWPALLLLASGVAALAVALCFVFPSVPGDESAFSGDGSAPLFRLGVGNRKQPVRRPPGATVMLDNRLRLGIITVLLLAAQTVTSHLWWQSSGPENSMYSFASSLNAAFVGALSLYSVFAFAQSERSFYLGLFPWALSVPLLVQLGCNLVEVYFSFFAAGTNTVPIFGRHASSRSNYLVLTTLFNVVVIVVLAMIQRHTIFLRPITSSTSESIDRYLDVSIDNSTPFAYKNDLNESYLVDTPESGSSLYGRVTFSWATQLFRRGIANGLETKDVYRLSSKDAQILNWKRYLSHRKSNRSMFVALLRTFILETALNCMCTVSITTLSYASPFFIQRILRYVESSNGAESTGMLRSAYLYAFGLLFFTNLSSVLNGQENWRAAAVSIQIKSFIRGDLSIKTLRRRGKGSWATPKADEKDSLSKGPQSVSDEGNLVNLIDSDMSHVSDILFFLKNVFGLPVSLGFGLFYIYKLLGVSALIGLSVAFLYIPLCKVIFEQVIKAHQAQRLMSDKRISMITEAIQGIRAVKLFGWESRFMKNIAEQHGHQLKYAWKEFSWTVVITVVSELVPVIVFVLILYMYTIVFGNKLTAEIAFTSLSVFRTVYNAILQVEHYFSSLTDMFVSIDRMNTYLGSMNIQDLDKRATSNTGNVLGFESADLEWMLPEEKTKDTTTEVAVTSSASAVKSPATEQTPLLSGEPSTTQIARTTNGSSVSLTKLNEVTPFSLKNIDVQFPTGGFSIVAGPTGSGKSSFLSALIGEMTLTRGSIMVPTVDSKLAAAAGESEYKDIVEISNEGLALHDIAYVAQEAWLRNATIRENILFGEAYEKERYEEVLRVCALKPDLRIFPAGDETEVGERGITLSGGQKQRLTLARAVYSDHRILLIDDCLSAVDAHTGKHILMECLLGRTKLMQGRTRVLITHHVPMCLPYADFMVMLNNGRVVLKGDPRELKAQGVLTSALKELDNSIKKADKSEKSKDQPDNKNKGKDKDDDSTDKTAGKSLEDDMEKTLGDPKSEDEYTRERVRKMAEQKNIDPNTDLSILQGILVKEEEREKGQVKFEVWKTFTNMCGGNRYWALLFGIMITAELFSTMKTYALRLWVSSNDENTPNDDIASSLYLSGINNGQVMLRENNPGYWLSIYMIVSVLGAFWGIFRMYYVYYGGIHAAQNIHKELLCKVMHAAPRFFDLTPVGRIVNRFAGDMNSIDQGSISSIVDWLSGFVTLTVTVVIILSVIPMFVFPAVLVVAAYAMIAYYYLITIREIRRIQSASMSPIISIFSEMINGVATIRAFGAKMYYIKESLNRTSNNNRCNYALLMAFAWMGIHVNATSAVVTSTCAVFILLNVNWIDAGLAGFILTYATSFSSETSGVINGYIVNEQRMNAVERVMQYLKIDQEAASESTPENKPPALWPKTGNVEIENLVAEHVPGVPVLHGVSLAVKHGEKIGVVGRTGAGKSTISLALLRFIEASKGRILLDGIDISKIGLEDLRRNVTIIPQDPVLFNGTVRYNIDPFEEYPDELIWDSLQRTHLTREQSSQTTSASASIVEDSNTSGELALERMTGIFSSLDDEITQNGQSLSQGQRQLVAMARALVRRSKLIIMDEATASVDFNTDERLQRTIRGHEFADSTLFCIAHRLRTIIDYDRVLVLDKGKVAEFDTPKNLLQKKDGIFRSMCENTGDYKYLESAGNR